jgi:sigma-E factor negative regulatory protein RseA
MLPKYIMNPSHQPGEILSALSDGQLSSQEVEVALQACERDQSLLVGWNIYHLIGEMLRFPVGFPAPVVRGADMAFVSRLSQRLAQESVLMARPQSFDVDYAMPIIANASSDSVHFSKPASNDENFRWKLLAGLASLAAVTAIAWNSFPIVSPTNLPQLAQASNVEQIVVASPQGPMVRDARLEELLAAHRQLGGNSALQVPSGFLRNATYEASQNAGR